MKSVVLIAYGFPPEGSAGTYWTLRFVRDLAKIGGSGQRERLEVFEPLFS